MANLYADGNYSTAYLTSNVPSYPFTWPNNSTTTEFALEYIQWANTYAAANLGSNSGDAPNAYLVSQGPIQKIAPGVLRFARIYCQLPNPWTETQMVSFTFPGLSGVPNGGFLTQWTAYQFRSPYSAYTVANIEHTYTISETSPTLDAPFISTDFNSAVDYIGVANPYPRNDFINVAYTVPNVEPNTYNVSSQSQMIRGTMWEKISITVPKPV